jgi:hypothetical protein
MTRTRSDGRIDVELERLGTRDLVQEVKKMGRWRWAKIEA